MFSIIIVVLLSYLIGAIPASLWMGKIFFKTDIRKHGSGNSGATNTFRILGWKAGVIVLLFDFGKGLLCTTVISQIAWNIGTGPVQLYSNWEVDAMIVIFAGVAAVIGHMFPIYANFNGGKGAATACGMLYGIEPVSISISLAVFLIVMFTTRYVSLGSIISTAIYPFSQLTLRYGFNWDIDGSIILFSSVVAIGIIVKHKGNIKRLIEGNENRVRSFKPATGKINQDQKEP